jgi:phospholipid/cholesterol/gamma-HCH transport system substrate-binding protein
MNEQARVGLVVIVAAILLVSAAFFIANLHFGGVYNHYHAYFKFAGGLEEGAPVRFAGLKVGRVNKVGVDPKDATRIQVDVEVKAATPVGSDSMAKVSQLTMLSENYVEITPGKDTKTLPDGSVIPSAELSDLNALIAKMGGLADEAKPLIVDLHKDLNDITAQANKVLANIETLTGGPNQAHLNSIMSEADTMMKTNRPKVDAMLTNFKDASGNIQPLMDDLKVTNAKLQKVLDTTNGMLDEDRDKIKGSIEELQKTLETARHTLEQAQSMLVSNSDNLDVMIDNFRQISDNFRVFSDSVKKQPSSLIWKDTVPDRQPPGAGVKVKKK